MAIDLKRVMKGKLDLGPRILVFAHDGVGKTTFAAGAPDPFFLDANKGSKALDVSRVFIETWDETFEWIDAIEKGDVKCKTVVLDTAGDFEAIGHKSFFPGTTVTKFEGGYNKGDDVVTDRWRGLLYRLERLWERGHGIIFTAHARVRGYNDPLGPSYDRYEVALRAPLAGLLRSWSDYVFFAQVQTSVTGKDGKTKGVTTGERVIRTRRTPAYDAKARGTSLFPEELPLSYDEFEKAVKADGTRGDEMRAEIDVMLAEIGDKKLSDDVRGYLKKWPTQIADAHNRVKIRLTAKKEVEQGPQEQQPQQVKETGT